LIIKADGVTLLLQYLENSLGVETKRQAMRALLSLVVVDEVKTVAIKALPHLGPLLHTVAFGLQQQAVEFIELLAQSGVHFLHFFSCFF
jgi:hypothetical protein